MKKVKKEENNGENKEIVGDLFPVPKTPLGDACEEYIGIKRQISELKRERDLIEDKILIEMEKEGRQSLLITIDGDNWLFEIKGEAKTITCVKKTRSPAPTDEED